MQSNLYQRQTLRPNLNDFQIFNSLWMGALFGLVAYGTYDLTNLATVKEWPLIVSLVDMGWGMFVAFSSASVAFFANKYVF